jgi:uncharacterized short protein YbdD (DUF466 family)
MMGLDGGPRRLRRARLIQVLSGMRWYLREVSGEADYDRYLVRHAQLHGPGATTISRREFERRRWEGRASSPGSRCC